ncbi:MAG: hypothetical protein NW203_10590, partial [Hyphomonadaceae bacterium]|nr:hypothetical protein [Hyphomonadaceae bacterium]
MQIKDLSAILATWVGIGGALTGGFFTFREYQRENAKSADERVLQTFSMYQDFRADLLPTAALIQEGRAAIGDLDFWINHFDMVEACVGADLCDASLVNQLFAPYAIESLTPAVQCRIADVRRMEAEYGLAKPQGHGLLAIAGRAEPVCAAPPPPPAPAPTAQAPAPTPTAQRRAPAPT